MVAHRHTRAYTLCLAAALTIIAACAQETPAPPESDDAKRAEIDAMYRDYRNDFPDVQDISAEELAKLREAEEVVIVDVRTPAERAVSVIPKSITKEEFEAKKKDLTEKPIIVHCTIGYRSGLYAEQLAKEGIEADNLAGSILSWVHAGQPVVDAEGNETKRVHVFGKKWDLLPEGYEGVW